MFQACFKDDGKTEKSVVLIIRNNGYNNCKGAIKSNLESTYIKLKQGFSTLTLVT